MSSRKLSDEEYQRLVDLLTGLEGHIPEMRGNSQQFVRDQVARHKQWGQEMFISEKQMSWLQSLHDEFVGTHDPEPDEFDFGLNDEMPY